MERAESANTLKCDAEQLAMRSRNVNLTQRSRVIFVADRFLGTVRAA
jgi:hypothetical protein